MRPERLNLETAYQVEFNFSIDNQDNGEEIFVKSFLPESNMHQTIMHESVGIDQLHFKTFQKEKVGKKGEWRGKAVKNQQIHYAFDYQGNAFRILPVESN